jgi:hypothetical protein
VRIACRSGQRGKTLCRLSGRLFLWVRLFLRRPELWQYKLLRCEVMPYWLEIFDQENLDFFAKGIYALLGKYADDGGKCWPSISTLCRKSGLSRSTIKRAIKNLVEAGCLEIMRRKTSAGDSDSNIYLLRVGSHRTDLGLHGTDLGSSTAEGGPGENRGVGSRRAPNLIIRTNPLKYSPEHLKLAHHFRGLITGRKPDFRFHGKIENWANDIRLMVERDGRSLGRIADLMKWVQQDSFWADNILSTAKLREKFDQLELKKQRGGQSGLRSCRPDGLAQGALGEGKRPSKARHSSGIPPEVPG